MQYYRRRNEAQALGKDFNDTELSFEEGRALIDGRKLDDGGKVIVFDVPQDEVLGQPVMADNEPEINAQIQPQQQN